MVVHQPGACGVEHYRSLFSRCHISPPDESLSPPIFGPRNKNLKLGGSPVNITMNMVYRFLPKHAAFTELLERSTDSLDYEVGGMLLYMCSLPETLLDAMYLGNWFKVPLCQWKDVIKPILDRVRRMGMFDTIKDDSVYLLRKLINVTYRRDTEADWAAERSKRCGMVYRKTMLCGHSYMKEYVTALTAFETRVITAVAGRSDTSPLDEWWARRHHLIPSGSTSCGAWLRNIMREDHRVTPNDRPNKKSAVEALPQCTMDFIMHSLPIHVARCSTKHEPGDKRRSLYADNEMSYLVTAYASTHTEKEMNFWGSCARQTPEDFMQWARASSRHRGYWVSADFSDYNGEHTLYELAAADAIRGLAWSKLGNELGRSKAAASLWSAQSHALTFAQFPDIGQCRVIQGLYSGSRDTQRNNTSIHYVHSTLARRDALLLGYGGSYYDGESAFYSGDDEDAHFDSPLTAAVHIKILGLQGHDLNPKKQLAGKVHHEFLQTMAHPGSTGQRPLAAILATLASGNWYVREGNWFGNNITSVSDNWWEAVCRGLPYQMGFLMACSFLDSLMRARDSKGKLVCLEWWSYRSPTTAHPLWGVVTKDIPVSIPKLHGRPCWPSEATDAWLKIHERLLQRVPSRKKELYRNDLLTASHGAVLHSDSQQSLEELVSTDWPARIKRLYTAPKLAVAPGFSMLEMGRYGENLIARSNPRTDDELAARLGVDPQIQGLIGSWNHLAPYLPGKRWSSFAQVVPAHCLTPRAAASNWAFRSWSSCVASFVPSLHRRDNTYRAAQLSYVYAPNGSGKTWLCNKFGDWGDIDAFAAPIGLDKPKYGRGLERLTKRYMFISLVLRRALASGCKVLLGQWDPADVEPAAHGLGLTLHILYFDPGEELRVERLKKRGWDESSIQHRRDRWLTGANVITDWHQLVKELT
jgi:hypothetical protein